MLWVDMVAPSPNGLRFVRCAVGKTGPEEKVLVQPVQSSMMPSKLISDARAAACLGSAAAPVARAAKATHIAIFFAHIQT